LNSFLLFLGSNEVIKDLEVLSAQFLGVKAAIVFGMGFATNALNLPSLLSPECLVMSDEKNHASMILGFKLSGVTIKIFKHNNMEHLETLIEEEIVKGQSNGQPWKKVFIVVEGIYSMEGTIVNLPEILRIKKKFKAYVYLDEAHSIGVLGPKGRGVTDYFQIDPNDIDVLMGTFTKSFASSGGYIAGSKKLINHLKANSHAHCYANSMTPAVVQQIISSMKIIMGLDGTNQGKMRIDQLRRNTRYFRKRLGQIGVVIHGQEDSPVIPLITFSYSRAVAFIRKLKDQNIGAVGVGYPSVSMSEPRLRLCLSSEHTKEQLDYVLTNIEKLAVFLGLQSQPKYSNKNKVEY
jgi:serine palmitoyltransferase